jgi:hypothetical protein
MEYFARVVNGDTKFDGCSIEANAKTPIRLHEFVCGFADQLHMLQQARWSAQGSQ